MDLKKINEVLANLDDYNLQRKYKSVQTKESAGYYLEKDQGANGEKTTVYDLGFDNLFLKTLSQSDSYGEDKGIVSVQFVTPVEKTVTSFDPI